MSGAGSVSVKAVSAQLAMELRLAARRGESLLMTLLVPLLLLAFFGAVPVVSGGGAGRPIDYLLPGILALAIMSTGLVGLSIATAFERQYGVLKRLGGSPLSRIELLLAKVGAVLVVEVIQVGLLGSAAGLLFGWRPGGQILLAVLTLLLGTLCFAGLGLLMAGALRAEATLAAANGLYLLFLLLGDMVFPLSQLPGWLTTVARLLPAAAFAEALRGALQPAGVVNPDNLLTLLVWGGLAVAAAARTFQWE